MIALFTCPGATVFHSGRSNKNSYFSLFLSCVRARCIVCVSVRVDASLLMFSLSFAANFSLIERSKRGPR